MTDVAIGAKDLLVAAGVGAFNASSGWSIHISKLPSKPDTAVSVVRTGGPPGNPRWLLDFPTVQVMVRGAANGYQAAESKVQAVKDTLLGLPSQDIGGDRWVAVNMLGDPVFLGYDENNRPKWSLNFPLIIEPATGANRIAL